MGFDISLSWRILLLLSLCAGPMFGCDVGWFGPFCRRKCHCINNQCDDMGTCVNGSRCDVGWFGPLCQYMNLASLEDGVIVTPSVPELTDSQNDTCSDIEAFSIIWKQAFEIEWIQIISRVTVKISMMKFFKVSKECNILRHVTYTQGQVTDIYFQLEDMVNRVKIEFIAKSFVCEIYVNGGRNLGLKHTTNLVTGFALDGNIDDHCDKFDKKLQLPFSTRANFNRIRIYEPKIRVLNTEYKLRFWDGTNGGSIFFTSSSLNHIDLTMANITAWTIELEFADKVGEMELCEIEVFGDSWCPPGFYGMECALRCHCVDPQDKCIASTGACWTQPGNEEENNLEATSSGLVVLSKQAESALLLSTISLLETYEVHKISNFITQLENLTQDSIIEDGILVRNIMASVTKLLSLKDSADKAESSSDMHRLLKMVQRIPERVSFTSATFKAVQPAFAVLAIKLEEFNSGYIEMTVGTESSHQLNENKTNVQGIEENTASDLNTMSISLASMEALFGSRENVIGKRLAFSVFQQDDFLNSDEYCGKAARINSYVISASIPNTTVRDLEPDFLITFIHLEKSMFPVKCAYRVEPDTGTSANWSTVGCRVVETSNEKTICACSHLTNFALIMDVYETNKNANVEDDKALSIITYVGCGTSTFGLALTLFVYSVYRKLRSQESSLIIYNLCWAMFLFNCVLLLGMHSQYLNTFLCKMVASFIHYFLLATMAWMAVNAVYMFICLILVFNTHFTFFLLKTCVAGWGFPLIIVAITLGVNKTESYGYTSSGICWVQRPEFYYVVVGPVLFTLVVNCTVFLMILHQLLRLSRLSGQTSLNESSTKRLARNFRSAVSLFVLLGLTWVFAFMAIGAANTVFTYLFALFSSLQGLFMFTLYCLLKEEVWTVLKNLCCGKDEFSDIKKNTMTTSSTFYKSSLNEEETMKDSYNITNKISHDSVESSPLKDTGDTT